MLIVYMSKCTESKDFVKIVAIHVWDNYMELAEDVRYSEKGKEIYTLCSQTIKRVFADAKEKHFMRYTQLRSKAKLKM